MDAITDNRLREMAEALESIAASLSNVGGARVVGLAALVVAEVAMAHVANHSRDRCGLAPAYGEDFVPEHYEALRAALGM